MNLEEYYTIDHMSYSEYCDYLQTKYGVCTQSYMTKNFKKNRKVARTDEGLYIHHKFEDQAARLCEENVAKYYPYEWQLGENLVYCDYLEHLFLHVLICEAKKDKELQGEKVSGGCGGILGFIVPELNDIYSGWKTKQNRIAKCHERILDDKEVYFRILQRFKTIYRDHPFYEIALLQSRNAMYGTWDIKNNDEIFKEIILL